MLPWMRHIPSVLAPWKRTVEEWNKVDSRAFHDYFDLVQKDVVRTCPLLIYALSLRLHRTGRSTERRSARHSFAIASAIVSARVGMHGLRPGYSLFF